MAEVLTTTLRLYAEARNVCYVNSNGVLNWNNSDNDDGGVRPFWWISEVCKPPRWLRVVLHIIKRVYNLSRNLRDKYNVMSVPCLVIDDGQSVTFGKKNIRQLLQALQ